MASTDKNADKKLPNKESALFRSIVRCYEMKQYKKGLKAADQILKRFPEHGETLSMKGLILNCMNRKPEAYDLVRKGLRYDLRSHVCWHVYGLLYRSDGDYAEAIKCYRNALRIDPENMQILRDLALLQVQKRDLKGFAETRRQQLTLKPNNRNHWIGFAVSHHLVKNYDMAINILDAYINTLDTDADRKPNYEDSEMMLYKFQILEESGKLEEALEFLDKNEEWIMDKLKLKQLRGELLARLERYDEAQTIFRSLLDVNSENFDYHRGLQCCVLQNLDHLAERGINLPAQKLKLTADQRQGLTDLYSELQKASPKSLAYRRIPLHFTEGTEFQSRVESYVKTQLRKAVPALGSELKYFYKDAEKVKTIEKLITELETSLRKDSTLPGSPNKEPPSTLLYTLYLAAQHYDRVGDHEKALKYIDECISHTPTALDFYQRKGRILKHAGDIKSAATLVDFGRKLDLQDRYINNKATEYFLQADRNNEADNTIALFTRHEGDPQTNLYEMQCMWYELECGKSFFRQKEFGKALKKLTAIEKHFLTFIEDQFDFHTYCLRKSTLRAYVDMIRFADRIYSFGFFKQAAAVIVKTYLHLYDEPPSSKTEMDEEALSAMSAADRKLAKAKARKEAMKKKKEAEAREREAKEKQEKAAGNNAKDAKKKSRREAAADPDPDGEQLLAKDPLAESWRFVSLLQDYAGNDVQTHLLAYDVAWRKKKALLCLQALKRALFVDPENPDVIKRLVEFSVATQNGKSLQDAPLAGVVAEVLEEEKAKLLGNVSVKDFLKKKMQAELQRQEKQTPDVKSLYRLVMLSKAQVSLDAATKSDALKRISQLLGKISKNKLRQQLPQVIAIHTELESSSSELASGAQELLQLCQKAFPHAIHFGNAYSVDVEALEGLSSRGSISHMS